MFGFAHDNHYYLGIVNVHVSLMIPNGKDVALSLFNIFRFVCHSDTCSPMFLLRFLLFCTSDIRHAPTCELWEYVRNLEFMESKKWHSYLNSLSMLTSKSSLKMNQKNIATKNAAQCLESWRNVFAAHTHTIHPKWNPGKIQYKLFCIGWRYENWYFLWKHFNYWSPQLNVLFSVIFFAFSEKQTIMCFHWTMNTKEKLSFFWTKNSMKWILTFLHQHRAEQITNFIRVEWQRMEMLNRWLYVYCL